MKVLEISECFPNKFRPVTGEFVYKHAKALSKYCSVIVVVPLRLIPPREIFSFNIIKSFSNLVSWYCKLRDTKNIDEGNLKVYYFRYFSLPRPGFEISESKLLIFFYYNHLKKLIDKFNPDILYSHWIRPWAGILSKYAAEKKLPLYIDHHEDIPTLKKLFPENYSDFLNVFDKADKIIVHSALNKEELSKEKPELKNIEIVYLGQNFQIPESAKIFNSGKIKIICVSHLNEKRKNIDTLLHAFKFIKEKSNAELIIIGGGIHKSNYEELAENLSIKNEVIFAGSKSQNELSEFYDNADIFVLPSYPEAFGIVFIEALSKGLPVVACEGSGGGEELKLLGYDTVLVKPFSEKDLSEAVLTLISDKERMKRMSVAGKKIVREHFTWEKNANDTFNILKANKIK